LLLETRRAEYSQGSECETKHSNFYENDSYNSFFEQARKEMEIEEQKDNLSEDTGFRMKVQDNLGARRV